VRRCRTSCLVAAVGCNKEPLFYSLHAYCQGFSGFICCCRPIALAALLLCTKSSTRA